MGQIGPWAEDAEVFGQRDGAGPVPILSEQQPMFFTQVHRGAAHRADVLRGLRKVLGRIDRHDEADPRAIVQEIPVGLREFTADL